MKRVLVTAGVAVTQLAAAPAWPSPLSARLTGDTYLMRVAPLDPIDPFRGAYVALDYPDLRHDDSRSTGEPGLGALDDGEEGAVYITLVEQDGVWVADSWVRDRPDGGTYLACDDRSWQIRCGIESLFQPQDTARETEALPARRRRRRGADRRPRQRGRHRRTSPVSGAQPPATAGITEICTPSGVGVARSSRKRTSSLPT